MALSLSQCFRLDWLALGWHSTDKGQKERVTAGSPVDLSRPQVTTDATRIKDHDQAAVSSVTSDFKEIPVDVDQSHIPDVSDSQREPVIEQVTHVTKTSTFGDEYRRTEIVITEKETVISDRRVHKEEYTVTGPDTHEEVDTEETDKKDIDVEGTKEEDQAARDQSEDVAIATMVQETVVVETRRQVPEPALDDTGFTEMKQVEDQQVEESYDADDFVEAREEMPVTKEPESFQEVVETDAQKMAEVTTQEIICDDVAEQEVGAYETAPEDFEDFEEAEDFVETANSQDDVSEAAVSPGPEQVEKEEEAVQRDAAAEQAATDTSEAGVMHVLTDGTRDLEVEAVKEPEEYEAVEPEVETLEPSAAELYQTESQVTREQAETDDFVEAQEDIPSETTDRGETLVSEMILVQELSETTIRTEADKTEQDIVDEESPVQEAVIPDVSAEQEDEFQDVEEEEYEKEDTDVCVAMLREEDHIKGDENVDVVKDEIQPSPICTTPQKEHDVEETMEFVQASSAMAVECTVPEEEDIDEAPIEATDAPQVTETSVSRATFEQEIETEQEDQKDVRDEALESAMATEADVRFMQERSDQEVTKTIVAAVTTEDTDTQELVCGDDQYEDSVQETDGLQTLQDTKQKSPEAVTQGLSYQTETSETVFHTTERLSEEQAHEEAEQAEKYQVVAEEIAEAEEPCEIRETVCEDQKASAYDEGVEMKIADASLAPVSQEDDLEEVAETIQTDETMAYDDQVTEITTGDTKAARVSEDDVSYIADGQKEDTGEDVFAPAQAADVSLDSGDEEIIEKLLGVEQKDDTHEKTAETQVPPSPSRSELEEGARERIEGDDVEDARNLQAGAQPPSTEDVSDVVYATASEDLMLDEQTTGSDLVQAERFDLRVETDEKEVEDDEDWEILEKEDLTEEEQLAAMDDTLMQISDSRQDEHEAEEMKTAADQETTLVDVSAAVASESYDQIEYTEDLAAGMTQFEKIKEQDHQTTELFSMTTEEVVDTESEYVKESAAMIQTTEVQQQDDQFGGMKKDVEETLQEDVSYEVDKETPQEDVSYEVAKETLQEDVSFEVDKETLQEDVSYEVDKETLQEEVSYEVDKETLREDVSYEVDKETLQEDVSYEVDKETFQEDVSYEVDKETLQAEVSYEVEKETLQEDMSYEDLDEKPRSSSPTETRQPADEKVELDVCSVTDTKTEEQEEHLETEIFAETEGAAVEHELSASSESKEADIKPIQEAYVEAMPVLEYAEVEQRESEVTNEKLKMQQQKDSEQVSYAYHEEESLKKTTQVVEETSYDKHYEITERQEIKEQLIADGTEEAFPGAQNVVLPEREPAAFEGPDDSEPPEEPAEDSLLETAEERTDDQGEQFDIQVASSEKDLHESFGEHTEDIVTKTEEAVSEEAAFIPDDEEAEPDHTEEVCWKETSKYESEQITEHDFQEMTKDQVTEKMSDSDTMAYQYKEQTVTYEAHISQRETHSETTVYGVTVQEDEFETEDRHRSKDEVEDSLVMSHDTEITETEEVVSEEDLLKAAQKQEYDVMALSGVTEEDQDRDAEYQSPISETPPQEVYDRDDLYEQYSDKSEEELRLLSMPVADSPTEQTDYSLKDSEKAETETREDKLREKESPEEKLYHSPTSEQREQLPCESILQEEPKPQEAAEEEEEEAETEHAAFSGITAEMQDIEQFAVKEDHEEDAEDGLEQYEEEETEQVMSEQSLHDAYEEHITSTKQHFETREVHEEVLCAEETYVSEHSEEKHEDTAEVEEQRDDIDSPEIKPFIDRVELFTVEERETSEAKGGDREHQVSADYVERAESFHEERRETTEVSEDINQPKEELSPDVYVDRTQIFIEETAETTILQSKEGQEDITADTHVERTESFIEETKDITDVSRSEDQKEEGSAVDFPGDAMQAGSEEVAVKDLRASDDDRSEEELHADVFVDRSERFLEEPVDTLRAEDEPADSGLIAESTDSHGAASGTVEPVSEDQQSTAQSSMPESDHPFDDMMDENHLALHPPLYPSSSTEVHDRSGTPSDVETEEPPRNGTAAAGIMVSYTSDVVSGTHSFLSESVVSRTSESEYTSRSETWAASECTMTGSEFEPEGRMTADTSEQIFIEQKVDNSHSEYEETQFYAHHEETETHTDLLQRPMSPSEYTLIVSNDQDRMAQVLEVQEESSEQDQEDEIEKDSLQSEESDERMSEAEHGSEQPPSPTEYTLVDSQEQEDLAQALGLQTDKQSIQEPLAVHTQGTCYSSTLNSY